MTCALGLIVAAIFLPALIAIFMVLVITK